jgi:hypothetical protein
MKRSVGYPRQALMHLIHLACVEHSYESTTVQIRHACLVYSSRLSSVCTASANNTCMQNSSKDTGRTSEKKKHTKQKSNFAKSNQDLLSLEDDVSEEDDRRSLSDPSDSESSQHVDETPTTAGAASKPTVSSRHPCHAMLCAWPQPLTLLRSALAPSSPSFVQLASNSTA